MKQMLLNATISKLSQCILFIMANDLSISDLITKQY